MPPQFRSASLTAPEEVQIFCAIAREQIEVGNYEAGYAVLNRWWTVGEWPRLEVAESQLFGRLAFYDWNARRLYGQHETVAEGTEAPEALLNGAIALFEQLGLRTQVAQSQIELAICYHRESIFNLARPTLLGALKSLVQRRS